MFKVKKRHRPKPRYPSECYINRELSWLEFNARVLEEAYDKSTPLLERAKFISIFSSNLDEFFEVRVAGLQEQVKVGVEPQDYAADGLDPETVLARIAERTHELVERKYRVLGDEVMPALREHGIERVRYDELSDVELQHVERLFVSDIYPVLTPLAIDPGHPFPHVHNKSLNLAVLLRKSEGRGPRELFGVVQVPSVVERVVVLPSEEGRLRFILLEDLIAGRAGQLFGGFEIVCQTVFRVTRNTDLTIDEDEVEDLLSAIEVSLRERRRGEAVRLEISAGADDRFVELLGEALDLQPQDLYAIDGPIDLSVMMNLWQLDGFRHLKDEPLVPRTSPSFAKRQSVFDAIRERDILVHHPYESFNAVVNFIDNAADDPDVLGIKQTLYRTSVSSPVLNALARAAQNGKQVTALVELKARFDEANNIAWARTLEEAGVHVVYGVVGVKTHCKVALVVRRESVGIRRYVHMATGNYNPQTARIYTDIGLFTADPAFGEDASELFNLLTGYSQGHEWQKVLVAPRGLRERMVELIRRERGKAEAGRPARIIAKMNALVEPSLIDELYDASQAGVEIDLLVRGICCLRPGLPGISERIRVRGVVDKFLEHSRVFYFENDGDPELFLGSADWMPRNFYRRIEIAFPVESPQLKERIIGEILPVTLADNVKARALDRDGVYQRLVPAQGDPSVRSQAVFQELARRSDEEAKELVQQISPGLRGLVGLGAGGQSAA
ncbi:MAG: polyphosphate kinase 1 [Gemmatimonadales bacterium]